MYNHRLFVTSPSQSSLNFNDAPGRTPVSISKSCIKMSEIRLQPSPTPGVSKLDKRKQFNIFESSQVTHSVETQNFSLKLINSSAADSDSESMSEPDIFSKTNPKLPYSAQEDEVILKFVLKGENIYKTGSISLWKQLENKKDNPKRTYQSLKNRFIRNIKPFIFSTYSYMIKDEETVKKILSKFPELQKRQGKKDTLSVARLPIRDALGKESCRIQPAEINSPINQPNREISIAASPVLSQDGRRNAVSNAFLRHRSEIIAHVFGEKVHQKKVELKNNSISVTFIRGVFVPEKRLVQAPGLYKKYLKLKKSNALVPCPRCGRGDLDLEWLEESESEDVIPPSCATLSVRTAPKRNSSKNSEKLSSSPTQVMRNRKRKADGDRGAAASRSPSLLNAVPEEEPSGSNRKKKSGNPNPPGPNFSKPPQNHSKNNEELLSDKDLDSLYRETVANCRMFMDSDSDSNSEEEEETLVKKSLRKGSGAVGFQPDLLPEKTDPESFFVSTDLQQSSTPSKQSPTRSAKKPDSEKKKPLAQNMVRMLRGSKKK